MAKQNKYIEWGYNVCIIIFLGDRYEKKVTIYFVVAMLLLALTGCSSVECDVCGDSCLFD